MRSPWKSKLRSANPLAEADGSESSYPEATTGTYAGRCTPLRAQTYSKCACRSASDKPGCAKRIVCPLKSADIAKAAGPTARPTLACARALISADAFMTSTSCVLLTLRSAPTSGASGLRFDVAIASRYASGSDLAARGCCRER